MYYKGKGVERDFKQAFFLFQQAAIKGYHDSQFNLAGMYAQGVGVRQDLSYAIYWYRQAADRGHVRSQLELMNNLLLYRR